MATIPHMPEPDDDADLPVEPDTGDGRPGIPPIPDDPEHDPGVSRRD